MATTIGERIRDLRERRGLSQAALVEGLDLSSSYVSLIEHGQRHPRPGALAAIAARLGCPVEYLRTGRGSDEALECELELRFAELALRSGDPDTARGRFDHTLNRARDLDQPDVVHEALWGRCRADEALGRLEDALEGLLALVAEPELPATVSRVAVMTAMARGYAQCGDLSRAIEVGEAALAASTTGTSGPVDSDELTELASTLAGCYYERGDLVQAYLLTRRVIAGAERGGSSRARAAAYWNAGVVAEARGDLRSAKVFLERALALAGESDNARATALLRLNCAALLLRECEPDHVTAAGLLDRALGELSAVGNPVDVATAETELARCHLAAGRVVDAARVAAGAIERLGSGARIETARARTVLGEAQLALGEFDAAVASYTAAGEELRRLGADRQAAQVWRELADGMTAMGLLAEANAAYRQAADAAGITGNRRAPHHVTAAATKVPDAAAAHA